MPVATIWWATGIAEVPVVKHEVRFLSDVKTLVTVNDEVLRIAALADINVVQGDPTQFAVDVPAGYEVTGVSGATVESSEIEKGALIVRLNSSTPRNHELLISMERPLSGTKADAPFLSFKDAQRETGEVLVEGTGAMELTATEGGGLKRMDLKEANPYLRSLSRFPLQAAFRYHRQPAENPTLALEWTRFPDSSVLAAVAEHAVVTTLVTVEGRTLTEVKLTIKNQAQPFLKVALPAGATIVSADVAGEKVKPVQGPDGNRVPLLRTGFRPDGPYEVSFVFMHSGTPFAKKGGSELALPSMDVPISLLEWELFLPEQYKVKDFGGDAIAAYLLPPPMVEDDEITVVAQVVALPMNGPVAPPPPVMDAIGGGVFNFSNLSAGQIGGVVMDPSGAVIGNGYVKVTNTNTGTVMMARINAAGQWVISNFPAGPIKIETSVNGFQTLVQNMRYDANNPSPTTQKMNVSAASEVLEVTASPEPLSHDRKKDERAARKEAMRDDKEASSNVLNLQKRVAGVLPVRVDVPKVGTAYHFARALVLDEETKVTFNYKTK